MNTQYQLCNVPNNERVSAFNLKISYNFSSIVYILPRSIGFYTTIFAVTAILTRFSQKLLSDIELASFLSVFGIVLKNNQLIHSSFQLQSP